MNSMPIKIKQSLNKTKKNLSKQSFPHSYQPLFLSDVDSHVLPTESICKRHHVRERQVESSLTYDLHPGDIPLPCKTALYAPEPNGFIVKLHKPKEKKSSHEIVHKSLGDAGRRVWNDSSCPLEIVSKFFLQETN